MKTADHSINLLEELNSISKIHHLTRDNIEEIIHNISERMVLCLDLERVSIWAIEPEKEEFVSLGEFDNRDCSFESNKSIKKGDFPIYFKSLTSNKIIVINNEHDAPYSSRYINEYIKPNEIISSITVPIRISSELVGFMRLEKTGKETRSFSESERSFCFSVGLVVSSALEARYRRRIQQQLEATLDEKKMLIREIDHRVKNNFNILISLLRISRRKISDKQTHEILNEFEQRILSMAKVQNLLHETESYEEFDIARYLTELFRAFKNQEPEHQDGITVDAPKGIFLPSNSAVHFGLLVTEIFINSIKYSLPQSEHYFFRVQIIHEVNGIYKIYISDSGKGFDFDKELENETVGLSLISGLIEDLGFKVTYPTIGKSIYLFEVDLEEN